ncbi:MAG: hypothetical protein HN350_07845, partial [Phycisphaerales bacterium]|nr:hypothetical protein [Phycisphaerales bacterium]
MKNLNTLACLLALAVASAAFAQDASVKVVKETKIFALDESRNISENSGIHSMRMSPDGKTLLYVERIPQAANQNRRGYRLGLRNIKTGKETILPGASCRSDDFLVAYVSMHPFDATGKKLILPITVSEKNEPVRPGKGQMKLGVYDIATAKLTELEMKAPIIFPSYDAAGKNLIVFAMFMGDRGPDMELSKIVVSPVDKIKFKKIGIMGMPRTPCPVGGILPILLPPGENKAPGAQKSDFVVYDMKADKMIASPPISSASRLDDYNPQWTGDGRYLYYMDSERDVQPDGSIHHKRIMRVWDRTKAIEKSITQDL